MSLSVGTSSRDITPPPGIELGGYLYRVQPSVGVLDPILLRCAYLENGDQRLLWMHADLLGVTGDFVAAFRRWAGAELGLEAHQVLVSATHTHSGPATVPLIDCGQVDPAYMDRLRNEFELAARAASEQVEPVQAVEAVGRCDLAVDRRGGAASHVDHRVGTLAFTRRDGSFKAVIANYAMHNVALGYHNRLISADVAGHAAHRITNELPGQPTVLFTAGACANVNPPQTGVEPSQMRAWGDVLSTAVLAALKNAAPEPVEFVASSIAPVAVRLHQPDLTWVDAVSERSRQLVSNRAGYEGDRYRHAIELWRSRLQQKLAHGGVTDHIGVELHAIAIGDTRFLAANAELFSRLADDLRSDLSRSRLWVVGYANGLLGYIPTRSAMDQGGYEVDNAFIFYDGLPVEPGAFEAIHRRAAALLQSLDRPELAVSPS